MLLPQSATLTAPFTREPDRFAPLAKGDSPQCGEMSRSDRGDGRPLGEAAQPQGGLHRRCPNPCPTEGFTFYSIPKCAFAKRTVSIASLA